MVQVLKDPIGTKGARLTTQISIAGRLLVHLPQDNHIGISQRIGDEAERDALRARISRSLLPPNSRAATSCAPWPPNASDEELAADIAYLRRIWAEIKNRAVGALPPMVLHQDLTLAQRVLRDLVTETSAA
jgi:ribonuclease G